MLAMLWRLLILTAKQLFQGKTVMAIFVIKPKPQPQQNLATTINDTVNHGDSKQITTDQIGHDPTEEDLEDMKKLGANMKESKITVRGPLSKVFSEALNKVLATESIMASIATSEEEEQILNANDTNEIFIYATSQDELDYNSGMTTAANDLRLALDSKKGSQVKTKAYLYMEAADRPSKRLDMMSDWCRDSNVEVITKLSKNSSSMRLAGEHIVNVLRGM